MKCPLFSIGTSANLDGIYTTTCWARPSQRPISVVDFERSPTELVQDRLMRWSRELRPLGCFPGAILWLLRFSSHRPAARGAGAAVENDDPDHVVAFAESVDLLKQPADLLTGVIDEPGVDIPCLRSLAVTAEERAQCFVPFLVDAEVGRKS